MDAPRVGDLLLVLRDWVWCGKKLPRGDVVVISQINFRNEREFRVSEVDLGIA